MEYRKYDIKAKPTRYRDTKFRSRLEASWAYFFTQCKLKYEYEPNTYTLDNGEWYLPDFWLWVDYGTHKQKWVIEIKPTRPTSLERLKAAQVSELYDEHVVIIYGQPYALGAVQFYHKGKRLEMSSTPELAQFCNERHIPIEMGIAFRSLQILTNKADLRKEMSKTQEKKWSRKRKRK